VARALFTAAVLSAMVLLGACGASAGEQKRPPARAGSPSGGSGRTFGSGRTSGSSQGACEARPRSVCVTASANGRTVALGVGWTVEVVLSTPNGIWSGPVELGSRLLRQLGEVRRVGGGASVAYRTSSPGQTELRAFERPPCRPGRVCPQYILVWELHIRVSRSLP
jgi:hypothetical protein